MIKIGFVDTFDGVPQFFMDEFAKLGNDFMRDDRDPHILIFCDQNFGMQNRDPHYMRDDIIRVFYTGENVRPFDQAAHFALTFDHIDAQNHMRLPLWVLNLHYLETRFNLGVENRLNFGDKPEERRFCGYVQSNPSCQKRNQIFSNLMDYRKVDAAGPHMNNVGFVIPRGEQGVIQKMQWLNQYKFTLACENGQYPGYCTEKMLEAWLAGTVPIYWGSATMPLDFNRNCCINYHDYSCEEAFYNAIAYIDRTPSVYRRYLNQPLFTQGNWETSLEAIDNKLKVFLERIVKSVNK